MELFKTCNKEHMSSFEHRNVPKTEGEGQELPTTEQTDRIPENIPEQNDAEARTKKINTFLAGENIKRDAHVIETTTLQKIIARKALAAAAAGLFLFGAAEHARGVQDPHPVTATHKERITLHDEQSSTETEIMEDIPASLKDLPTGTTLRRELAEAQALEDLKAFADKADTAFEGIFSASLPVEISSTLTMDQEELLSKKITEARVAAARQLINPLGTTKNPEAAYRHDGAAEHTTPQSTEDRTTTIESALRADIQSLLPQETISALSPEDLTEFLDEMSHVAEDLSDHNIIQQNKILQQKALPSIDAYIGVSLSSRDTAPQENTDVYDASSKETAEQIFGVRISGNLNNLSPEAITEAFGDEIQSITERPTQKIASQLLGFAITK